MTKPKLTIDREPDVWGWFHIRYGKEVLQGFRTEKECRQWVSDCTPILRAKGMLP